MQHKTLSTQTDIISDQYNAWAEVYHQCYTLLSRHHEEEAFKTAFEYLQGTEKKIQTHLQQINQPIAIKANDIAETLSDFKNRLEQLSLASAEEQRLLDQAIQTIKQIIATLLSTRQLIQPTVLRHFHHFFSLPEDAQKEIFKHLDRRSGFAFLHTCTTLFKQKNILEPLLPRTCPSSSKILCFDHFSDGNFQGENALILHRGKTYQYTHLTNRLEEKKHFPDNIISIVTISTWSRFSRLMLNSDGKIYIEGKNTLGHLGQGERNTFITPYQQLCFAFPSKPIHIAHCNNSTFTLCQDGEIFAWGSNLNGILGLENKDPMILTPQQVLFNAASKPIKLITNNDMIFVLCEAGEIYGWGAMLYDVLDPENTHTGKYPPKRLDFQFPSQPIDLIISNGGDSVLIRCEQGELFGFGNNGYGQLGVEKEKFLVKPTHIPLPAPVITMIFISNRPYDETSVLVSCNNKKMYGFGGVNRNGHLGVRNFRNFIYNKPIEVACDFPSNVTTILRDQFHIIALCETGEAYQWGEIPYFEKYSNAQTHALFNPQRLFLPPNLAAIALPSSTLYYLDKNNKFYKLHFCAAGEKKVENANYYEPILQVKLEHICFPGQRLELTETAQLEEHLNEAESTFPRCSLQ